MNLYSNITSSSRNLLRILLMFVWFLPNLPVRAGITEPVESREAALVSPPSWSVNPLDYEYNMSMVIRVQFTGTNSNNPANVVGVFVGNELRGVASATMIGGVAYYFTTVYSNEYVGETVRVRVYYAPDDAVYATGATETFLHNKTIGSIGSAFFVNIDPNADYPPELEPLLADTTLQGIAFDPVVLADYLVSLDGDPVTWSTQPGPNLNAVIVNGILTVTPVSGIWTGTDSVRIIVTENTPNMLADTITGWFTVLPDYGLPVWQDIPDQTIFQGGAFAGFDLDDYLDFNGDCHGFELDVFPFTGMVADPAWPPVDPGAQPMSVVARPLFADIQLAGPGTRLAAFVNGVLAGSAAPSGVAPNITYSLLLKNVGAGPITFQLYDAANQYLYEKNTTLVFAAGGTAGTIASPYLIQLSPLVPILAPDGTVEILVADPTWLGAYPVDFIVWDCHFPDSRRDTIRVVYTVTNDIRPEISSPATVSFEENACSVLYDTQTSDPNDSEGAGLTYSLAGGADAARFSINAQTGILSWATGFSPDFENPSDADANNQYLVNIRVTNTANLHDTLSLTVTVTNQAVEPFVASINNGAGVVCTTGTVNLQAAGGVSYLWSTGSTLSLIVVNGAGAYTVTVTSSGACTATAAIVIAPPPVISAAGNSTQVCLGSPIQLSSTPSGGTPPYAAFAWSGPNGYTSGVEDPPAFPAVPASAGVYTVTLTDAATCTATASKTITVSGSPAPVITAASNSPVCTGANIQLSSTPGGGSGTFTLFSWAGPNNYTASGQNPAGFVSTLASAGTYMVTVTDNAGCTGVGSTAVQVNPAPAIAAGSNTPVCVGGTILLNSTPSGGSGVYTGFQWSGPAGFTAGVEDPAGFPATLAATGTYTVTVTDNAGCSATKTTVVTVSGLPAVTATLLGPVCTGGSVALGSTPSGGSGTYTSFQWSGPGGYTAAVEDPAPFAVAPGVAGVYTVTVTDQTGCTATASVTVVIHALPAITAANSSPVCQGQTMTLTSTPSGGSGVFNAFMWTGPDNYVASSEDPAPFSTTLASAGLYQVKVTDSEGCTATATTVATVNPKPTLTATSNAPICTGGVLNLQSTPLGGSGVYAAFTWTGPAGYTAGVEDPPGFVISITNAGMYQVTVTDNAGCSATASTSVAISTSNAPSVTATSNSPICSGNNLSLSSTPSGGTSPYQFSWAGPNNYTASQEDPTAFQVFVNGGGQYTVTVTDNKNCKVSATATVVVNGPAVAPGSNSPVCPGGNILLTAGGTGVSYSWAGPNNFTSNVANPPGFPATPLTVGVYTVSVTDNNGCVNRGSVTVTIGDITPPMITCPANTTVAANATCGGIVGAYTALAVSDNCAANPTVTQSPAASTALSGHNDAETVTLTANDGNGNTAGCTFTVTLKDVTAPVITCPANVTVAANANCAGVVGAYSAVSVTDNCAASPTVTQSPAASTALSGHNDVETVTLTANDGNSNTANCSFTVTLKDVTAPVITCPANVTLAADANCSGIVGAYSAVSVSDNCNANPAVTQNPVSSTVLSGHNDVEMVTLTANDGNGNTANCNFTVTLKDVTQPEITCPANATVAADGTCNGIVGAYTAVAVSDNCTANPLVTQSPVSSTLLSGHNDVETVTLTADDGHGNTRLCTFTVTLRDVTPPVITCPANATVAADVNCSGVVGAYAPVSVTDNCNANPAVTQSPVSSTILSGHNDVETVTLTANDGNGNTQFCTFTVTLRDVTKPAITCPPNTTVAADAACSGMVGAYTAVAVSDNCTANPAVTQSPVSSTLLSGHNDVETVTLTADDGNGNTEICTFTVTLKDITKPVITCPANTTLAADANCSSPVGAYTAVTVSDNCTANPAVTQTPPASTLLVGHNDVETITLTADDGNGNTQFCTFTVMLLDITPPTVICKPYTAALNAAGTTGVTTADVFLSGADNCGVVNQVSVVPNAFTCAHLGANNVVLTINDGNGNSANCTAVVTVVDLIPPTMLCRQITKALNAGGMATVTAAEINNNSTDNCTLVTLSLNPTSFTCANLGVNTVTLTGTDQSGNTGTCQGTVTIIDNLPPTMICQNVTLNLNNAGQATLTVAAINNGSFDNCTIVTFTLSQTVFTCAHLGNNSVTLTGTDQSGNSGFCTATVTVRDLILPVAKCKNIIANLNTSGTVTVLPTAIDNGSTDNCSFTLSLTPSTFNCSNLGINAVTLRATDGSGNSSTCTATIQIKDVTPPTALCKNAIIFLNDVGLVTLNPNQVDNGSSDNCSIATRTLNRTQYNCSDIGAPVNAFMTVTDGSGNSTVCTGIITVKDNLAPTAVCHNTTVMLDANGTVTVYPSMLADSSFDNCSVWSFSPVARTYTTGNIGNNNLLITVRDWTGNAATCTSVVTVLSNSAEPRPDSLGGKGKLKLLVSPNPSDGDVQLQFELPDEQSYTLRVFDMSGHLITSRSETGVAGENTIVLRRELFLAGIYSIHVQLKDRRGEKRLMIR